MQFEFNHHSPLPVVAQLQEQIKIALLLGRLRPGDTLPSIRDVEKQLGISRNFVRKAYLNLEESGILTLRHGKGVLVHKNLKFIQSNPILQKAEVLVQRILSEAEGLGLVPSAFARYLYQRAITWEASSPLIIYVDAGKKLAEERAAKVSSFWQIRVPAISLDELGTMGRDELRTIRKILTNYIRYDEVRSVVKNRKIQVLPLGLAFSESMISEFSKLPRNSSIVLILDDRDHPWLQLIAEPYKRLLSDPSVKFTTKPMSKVKDLARMVRSREYAKVLVSNRLWEQLPESIRHMPGITRPQLEIDLASLEDARIKAGVIL